MTTRTVAVIETASNEMVGSFKIKNVLPTRNLKQIDPFLLIHHLQPFDLKPGADARIPPHPHAGFEVVTYLLDGEFFHRDSKQHDLVAKGGDINWMTSGSGIIHSEGPTENFLREGGRLQLLQIWINLPSKQKKQPSSFRHYAGETLPVVENEKAWVKVLLGTYEGKQSPIETHTPMFAYHVKIKAGNIITLPVHEQHSSGAYLLEGKIKVLNETVKAGQLVHFNTDGNQLVFTSAEDASVLVFGGEPINEKVVSYGPFVMNSFEEIQQSMADYESGKMGVLDY
jgi:quercetin 2,3-dioxygenase